MLSRECVVLVARWRRHSKDARDDRRSTVLVKSYACDVKPDSYCMCALSGRHLATVFLWQNPRLSAEHEYPLSIPLLRSISHYMDDYPFLCKCIFSDFSDTVSLQRFHYHHTS